MNKKILNNNVILVFAEEFRTSSIPVDGLKTLAVSTFSDASPNPVVVSMSEFVSLFVPEAFTSIQMQDNIIAISDQKIGDFTGKDIEKFYQFVKAVEKKAGRKISAYAFNFLYEVECEDFERCKAAFDKFYKSTVPVPNDATLSYGIPSVVFKTGTSKMKITFNPVLENLTNEETGRVQISSNVHFQKDSLVEDLGDAVTDYKQWEQKISSYIDSVLGGE